MFYKLRFYKTVSIIHQLTAWSRKSLQIIKYSMHWKKVVFFWIKFNQTCMKMLFLTTKKQFYQEVWLVKELLVKEKFRECIINSHM